MRKLKRILSLVLTMCIFIGMGSDIKAQAQTIEEVAKLEIKVKGEGTVIVNDGYSEYSLEDNDVLRANATVNSDLKLTVTPNDGYLISSISGVDSQVGENGNSRIYEVSTKLDGTFIDVSFEKETKEEVENEIKEETKEEVNNTKEEVESEIKEEAKEEANNEIKEEKGVSEEAKKFIAEYEAGNYTSLEALEFRKSLVATHKLEDYVDESFFFKEEYLKDLEDTYLGDLLTLIRLSSNSITSTDELFDAYYKVDARYSLIPSLNRMVRASFDSSALDLAMARSATVMRPNHNNISAPENSVSYYEGGYFMGRTGVYSVNGRAAFCADHTKTDPPSGTLLANVHEETNDLIRKVLYYGSEGPAQIGGWTYNSLRLGTAMAISNIRHGTKKTMGVRLTNAVSGLASPPSSFKAYIGDPSSSHYQSIAFWDYSPKGTLQISKSSADPSITNGNSYYDITGAEYGVYTGSNATGQVATLTIGSNGWSQEISLDAGTYYIKEIKAPKGYALDGTIYPITVNSGSRATMNFTDRPQTDPVSIILSKVDADTGNASPQGNGTLADAQFTIRFYAGEYNDGINPGDLGIAPTKTWILKTDSNGRCRLNDAYKVSGDSFWYNSQGLPTLPLGTLTIQETKAPIGYKINSEIFIRRITPNGTAEGVSTYNEPIIKEDSLNFVIKKVQSGTSTLIPNAKFRHTLPDGTTEELQTGSNGEVVIRGLTQGIHKIVEFEAPEGYEVNKNEFVFEVKSDNTINVISNTTNMGMSYSEFEGDGILTVNDDVKPFSIRLTKVNDKGAVLEGAEFTLYSDSACNNAIETQVSDGNGNLKFLNLKPGTKYYMKETKAPEGYRIPVDIFGKVHVYEIYVESTPVNNVFDYYIDGVKYTVNDTDSNKDVYLAGTKSDREVNIKVVNTIGMKLPKTGSWLMIPILLIGVGLMSYSVFSNKKKMKVDKGE